MDVSRERRLRPGKVEVWAYGVFAVLIATLAWVALPGHTVGDAEYWVVLFGATLVGLALPWAAYWAAYLLSGERSGVRTGLSAWRRAYISDLVFDLTVVAVNVTCVAIDYHSKGNLLRALSASAYIPFFIAFVVIKQVMTRHLWRDETGKALETGDYSALNDERNRAVQAKAEQSAFIAFLGVGTVGGCLYELLIQHQMPGRTLVEMYVLLSLRQLYLAYWNRRL